MQLATPISRRRNAPAQRLRPPPSPLPIRAVPPRALALRKAGCSCGGGCPACKSLVVAAAHDPAEREADRVADQVMSMPAPQSTAPVQRMPEIEDDDEALQRQPEEDEEEEMLQASAEPGGALPQASPMAGLGSGQPLSAASRAFFEPRFGRSFDHVRVHDGAAAHERARSVNSRAFAYDSNIVFNQNRYNPDTQAGRHLLAHELTHVVQQGKVGNPSILRYCDDPDFCTPYSSQAEIDRVEWWVRNTYLRMEGVETFGTDVKNLYVSYLDRSPGDSLEPRVFSDEESYLVSAFRESGDTEDDMDDVIDLVGARLSRSPAPLRPGKRYSMSLTNFLSESEMNNRPINYSNPFSVAGHIAGGIGSSAAGDDYRKITASVALEKVELYGNTGYVKVDLTPQYEVFDAIDFCPGDCGSPIEQWITIPMSRLEASGAAYDVPFKVIFQPDTRTKRFWF